MPLYTFECPEHGDFDILQTISETTDFAKCPNCDEKSHKVIAQGHGGVQRKDSAWVRSLNEPGCINESGPPLTTVEDLRAWYQRHPNIKPKESHPAFPSSIGDVKTKPTEREKRIKRRKMAEGVLKRHRSITINTNQQPGRA